MQETSSFTATHQLPDIWAPHLPAPNQTLMYTHPTPNWTQKKNPLYISWVGPPSELWMYVLRKQVACWLNPAWPDCQ